MAGRVLALPNQTPGLKEQYGLTREQVDDAVWAIETEGRKFAGAAASNRIWQELGGVWLWLSWLYRVPFLCWLEDRAYAWIAAHRGQLARWWSAVPECEQPGVKCESAAGVR
jgi:predicted DCC family thiol-disulfide oxidoreductase YuxK